MRSNPACAENDKLCASREAAKVFLAKLAGSAAEELDFLLYDNLKKYRLQNQLCVLGKAQGILEWLKTEPNVVPLRILLPVLEGAALEDDETLIAKWAALLANAANRRNSGEARTSFAKILAELEPLEAKLMDLLAAKGGGKWTDFRSELAERLKTSEDCIDDCCGNLMRLGLARFVGKPIALAGSVDNYLEMTMFGKSFLLACSPPERP